jgi:hypothetical protein
MKWVRGYLVIFAISILTAFGAYSWMPNYRGYLFREDGLIENLSAVFYLISFFLGLLFFFKSNIHRKALIIISAVGLLGFLDELSFGERLFGFNMPQIHGVKIDAVHDFFILGCKAIKELTYSYPIYVFLFLGVGIIMVTIVTLKYSYELKETMSNIYHEPPFILALFFTTIVFSALVIDLKLVHHGALFMVEELFEMNAAIALLFCCLSLYEQRLPNKPTIRPA